LQLQDESVVAWHNENRGDGLSSRPGFANADGNVVLVQAVDSETLVPHNGIAKTLNLLDFDAKLCDVGAGGRRLTPTTLTADAVVTPNADLVDDIHNFPLRDASLECVFYTGTFLCRLKSCGRHFRTR
jgi:hypothetical protein